MKVDYGDLTVKEKERKRQKLRWSKHEGKVGERWTQVQAAFSGYKTKRTGVGHDFKAKPMLGSGKEFYIETKTGPHAKLSKRQKQAQKKLKDRYVIHRPKPYFGVDELTTAGKKTEEKKIIPNGYLL